MEKIRRESDRAERKIIEKLTSEHNDEIENLTELMRSHDFLFNDSLKQINIKLQKIKKDAQSKFDRAEKVIIEIEKSGWQIID